MKKLLLNVFLILTSVCFGQLDMKIYKKNGQVESVSVSQVDSVKYSTSSPITMNVYKNNNTSMLSVSINDIDSIKYVTNSIPVASITGLDCVNANTIGVLTKGIPVSGVSTTLAYTGGNGGVYTKQTIFSTGAEGLTASLIAGTFAKGNGKLTYSISGTPTTSGTASFEINIGGKTCVLKLTVLDTPKNPTTGYGDNISDIDGNSYKTVYIGTQQWMAENLKTAKYNDGTAIPNVTDNTQWSQLTTSAWSYYNNDAANNAKYGKLYNWYAVIPATHSIKNVCPTGWHVPTDQEWSVLTDYLGGESVAGGKMKEVGTANWNSPNTDATNTSLFTGFPGGFRGNYGDFFNFGSDGYWWSSDEYSTYGAWYRFLKGNNGSTHRDVNPKLGGFSVRCLKD